ncbi:multidrug efflux system subunit MdtC [Rosistilla ulvae]|uniref:Multidrug efflux system subunit MdtC n=1 Tax=Rosistilla ulvae TaxID=1930277 RepID=A0A517M106_9BACT|nr:efflux RND transporter permease subunit [Rosistilla ulvae]QDS88557.1 multidrug efflux system subunit MdtC [Rosistilla ulvae]
MSYPNSEFDDKAFADSSTNGFGRLVDHAWIVAAVILLITGFATIGYVDPTLLVPPAEETSVDHSTTSEAAGRKQRATPNVRIAQLAGFDLVLLVHSGDLFTPSSAAALRHVVSRLEALPQVDSVHWMDRAPPLNIFGLREPVFPKATASESRFDAAKAKALGNPMIGGFLLSGDAKSTLVNVNIDWLFVRNDEDCTTAIREAAEQAASEIQGNDLTFQMTGRVPLELSLRKRNRSDERTYQIIANVFTMIMAIILFRGVIAVLIVALAPGLGVYWTLGLLNYFDLQDNPFNHVVLPILISLVGFTDGVHMMVQIRANRAAGMPPRAATRRALSEVGLACGLTSLTTAIGFGSLSLAHHRIVQEFGWCCVLGVVVTFIAVVTVIPLLCMTPLGLRVQSGHSRGWVDRNFGRAQWIVDSVIRNHRRFAIGGMLGLAVMVGISSLLRPDERRNSALPSTGEELEALRAMDQNFGGLETAKVEVEWTDAIGSDSPEVLQVMQQVDAALQAEPQLGFPISIATLVAAMPGEGDAADRASLIELLPPPLKRAFFTPEQGTAMAMFRVQDLGIAKYGPVFERVDEKLQQIAAQHPYFTIKLAGDAVWRWQNLYQIVVDLALSLGTAIVIIFIVLSIVYRSIRIGLISIVPNVFPLAATGTLLVFAGQSLEIVSVCAFTVCLGIAVDDTIHFLTRYNEERKKTDDKAEAIRRSFVAVGTALIITTIVLVAGFVTALSSDTRDHQIFATMGILTITSALFADLIFLPALLTMFPGRKR